MLFFGKTPAAVVEYDPQWLSKILSGHRGLV
jgi:hypothetical protein